jgi:GT2 family glycosyltransferase/glycosyltransferase involved in cell wall biosynthesis
VWAFRAGVSSLLDVAFAFHGQRSGALVEAWRRSVRSADIVVVAHPWVYPFVADLVSARQLMVYDAHDVEAVLQTERLGATGLGTELARQVARLEHRLCRDADLILSRSPEHRVAFQRLYGLAEHRIAVIPNGAFTDRVRPAPIPVRMAARHALGIEGGPLALFVGGREPADVEAARFLLDHVAPATAQVEYAIVGAVGEELTGGGHGAVPCNVRITGRVDDDRLALYLEAGEIAPRPMLRSSGVSVELAEALSAGLAVAGTPHALSGLVDGDGAVRCCQLDELGAGVAALAGDRNLRSRMGRAARQLAEERHAWERSSPALGSLLRRAFETKGSPRPRFSVIVPTYERPGAAQRLVRQLRHQACSSFEVVVVDQSPEPAPMPSGSDLLYVHTRPPSIARARNLGAFLARGEILAFTDDDCRPLPDWLSKADRYFDDPRVVGLEGRILSHGYDDPALRPVANAGLEGVGFMTANLLVRRGSFFAQHGFDQRFATFREDTDLGWRLARSGRLPFAHDVLVYHRPHSSHASPAPAFELDALLLRKHPERFPVLFAIEGHWRRPAYFEAVLRAAAEEGVAVDLERLVLTQPTRLRDPRAGLSLVTPAPRSVCARQVFDLWLNVRNESDGAWSSALARSHLPVNASYRWLTPTGKVVVESGIRSPLPRAVWPGEAVEVQVRVRAPDVHGPCELIVTLVQEECAWFDAATRSAARARIDVSAGSLAG